MWCCVLFTFACCCRLLVFGLPSAFGVVGCVICVVWGVVSCVSWLWLVVVHWRLLVVVVCCLFVVVCVMFVVCVFFRVMMFEVGCCCLLLLSVSYSLRIARCPLLVAGWLIAVFDVCCVVSGIA